MSTTTCQTHKLQVQSSSDNGSGSNEIKVHRFALFTVSSADNTILQYNSDVSHTSDPSYINSDPLLPQGMKKKKKGEACALCVFDATTVVQPTANLV